MEVTVQSPLVGKDVKLLTFCLVIKWMRDLLVLSQLERQSHSHSVRSDEG
jgi:hypothetical protein